MITLETKTKLSSLSFRRMPKVSLSCHELARKTQLPTIVGCMFHSIPIKSHENSPWDHLASGKHSQFAIENGHRNSGFSHEKWVIFHRFLYVYRRVKSHEIPQGTSSRARRPVATMASAISEQGLSVMEGWRDGNPMASAMWVVQFSWKMMSVTMVFGEMCN